MKMIIASLMTLLASQSALADSTTYDVKGMHCDSCAAVVKSHVCKMDGIEKCDVTVGKIVISPKAGVTISADQIQAVLSKAGDYKLGNSAKSK